MESGLITERLEYMPRKFNPELSTIAREGVIAWPQKHKPAPRIRAEPV